MTLMLPSRRDFLAVAAVTGLDLMLPFSANNSAHSRAERVSTPLSALRSATTWLNSAPLDETQLRGKVVLVNFCTYTCINWLRSLPYVRAWAATYRAHGLVVIGVHTPEFGFEHDVTNVRPALENMRIEYPVAVDNDYRIWNGFANQYWPASYLIDTKGRVRHHKFGEGGYDEMELMIQRLLPAAGNAEREREHAIPVARGAEIAADWKNLASDENYLGAARTEHFVSKRDTTDASRVTYAVPSRMKLNEWALAGEWIHGENAAMLRKPNGKIVCRFRARDFHLVMSPVAQNSPVPFRVRIDGNAPGVAAGADIDERGEGMLNSPRLYQLLRQRSPITEREFSIEFPVGGVDAYAFTFG